MTDELRHEIGELNCKIDSYAASVASLERTIKMLSAFGKSMSEYSNEDYHREAFEYAYNTVGVDRTYLLDVLCDYGVTDRNYHEREFHVTVQIPVYFTMNLKGTDEDEVYERAQDEVGGMWLSDIIDSYSCDFDGSEITITDIEEN